MKLFMIYIGGTAGNSNIEVHDIRFVAAENIENTYPTLKQVWYGNPKSLHLDSYVVLHNIDGYQVELVKEKPNNSEKLYFVNMGGYRNDKLAEQHEFGLFVAKNSNEAKSQAKKSLLVGAEISHKDDLYDVDDCAEVNVDGEQYFVKLTFAGEAQALVPDWFGYNPIGK